MRYALSCGRIERDEFCTKGPQPVSNHGRAACPKHSFTCSLYSFARRLSRGPPKTIRTRHRISSWATETILSPQVRHMNSFRTWGLTVMWTHSYSPTTRDRPQNGMSNMRMRFATVSGRRCQSTDRRRSPVDPFYLVEFDWQSMFSRVGHCQYPVRQSNRCQEAVAGDLW